MNLTTDDINRSLLLFSRTTINLTVIKLISVLKSNSVFTAVSYFLVENGNLGNWAKTSSCQLGEN